MTRGLSGPFIAEMTNPPLTLARLFHITLLDNTIYRFTDHDTSLVVNVGDGAGAVVWAASNAISSSAIEATNGSVAPNAELQISYADGLTRDQVVSGLLDNARIIVRVVSWANIVAGSMILISGLLQRKDTDDKESGTWNIKGITRLIDGLLGEVYSEECRNQLGDVHCQVVLTSFTKTYTVTNVLNAHQQFDISVDGGAQVTGYFSQGFTLVEGDTLPTEVLSDNDLGGGITRITLAIPKFAAVEVGFTGTIVAGCKKRLITDCLGKFNNVVNYRGEPFNPTDDISTTGSF